MKKIGIVSLVVALMGLTCFAIAAADAPPVAGETAKAAPAQETAVYAVPGIEKGTTIKDLSKAIGEKPGIVSAQADKEKGVFKVTFDKSKTNPQEILKALTAVTADIKLDSVSPADPKAASKHDCGKCPSKKSCGKSKG